MILLIDNYDSFTYNLAHLLESLGGPVEVVRNDRLTAEEAEAMNPSHLVISPGPGRPADAGNTMDILRRLAPRIPVLGVCLGHQAIVEAFGGTVGPARRLVHGKTSEIQHDGKGLFKDLVRPLEGGRYHSLAATTVPDELEVCATAEDGEVMAVRHRELPIHGIQFHPESVLTPLGPDIVERFLAPNGRKRPKKEETLMIGDALSALLQGEHLTRDQARGVMDQIMRGEATAAQIAGFLVALRARGESVDEIAGCAEAMRAHALPVHPTRDDVIDTAGTGGDDAGTLNLSTAAALVAAAAGAGVAKHGNRAVSSACGSADVLEALGFDLELEPEAIARSIDELGFGFMFAPFHHPAMRHAVPVRKELATRTVFNILGPLTNPAGARGQVVGVYAPELAPTVATVLSMLGTHRALVVHGAGGIDELSPAGPNLVYEVTDGQVLRRDVDPADVDIPPCRPEDLRGGSAAENASAIRAIFGGMRGPARDAILLNAAAALLVAGLAQDLREGVAVAARTVDSGAAADRLESLVAFSRSQGVRVS